MFLLLVIFINVRDISEKLVLIILGSIILKCAHCYQKIRDCLKFYFNVSYFKYFFHPFTCTIAQFVRASGSITELRVACCELCEESVQEVALALAHNNTLRKMELQSNPIGKKGAQALAEMLSTNNSLVLLSLVGCGSMQATGATKVVEALRNNVTLKNLQLPEGYKDSVTPLHFYRQIQHRINWLPDVSTPNVNLAWKYVSVKHLGEHTAGVLLEVHTLMYPLYNPLD